VLGVRRAISLMRTIE
jgi:hypothetical protein